MMVSRPASSLLPGNPARPPLGKRRLFLTLLSLGCLVLCAVIFLAQVLYLGSRQKEVAAMTGQRDPAVAALILLVLAGACAVPCALAAVFRGEWDPLWDFLLGPGERPLPPPAPADRAPASGGAGPPGGREAIRGAEEAVSPADRRHQAGGDRP